MRGLNVCRESKKVVSATAAWWWASALTLPLMWTACGESTARTESTSIAQVSLGGAKPTGEVVTLITGDRVTVRKVDGGRTMAIVDPGPGRANIAFSIREERGELTVIPADVLPLLSAGRLDRALFQVTRLLADGFGDAARDHVPLIVTGAGAPIGIKSGMVSAGVSIERTLPTLGILAVRQRKGASLAALEQLTRPMAAKSVAGRSSASPAKIWLDRRRKLSLDHSVAQIGAPAAHARGLSGTGVTVAVLDTGVDATHPDLLGKVALAASFIEDGLGNTDPHGHGTHVASTIAGSGAASSGQRRGVAPGATLLSGRVCHPVEGCPESAILAGMEWAVSNGAQIVNLSLGGPDSPEIDPLEAAINQLSEEHGTLFVVAAGNNGGAPETVASPSTAEAALSVGAVDGADELVPFSSQGPRAGDHGIKPELTAPGVGIVAARATGTQMGTPVDDHYTSASGTSMATPHVAGAAALLLQQHPTWSGSQLKAALVGATQPNELLTIYEQGAGRIDVDRATRQPVHAEPGSLSLGIVTAPHDDDPPIVRTVRYYNHGAEPISLALTASLGSLGSGDEPEGMIRVTPASLIVPASGFADAELTVDTSVQAADGLYGGALLATGEGTTLRTPIGVDREGQTHGLTVSLLDPQGQPGSSWVAVVGVGVPGDPAFGVRIDQEVEGQATFRLPPGTYLVEAADFQNDVILVAPRVELAADATTVMDARVAMPFDLTLPDAGYSIDHMVLYYQDSGADAQSLLIAPRPFATAHLGPPVAGAFSAGTSVSMVPSEAPARTVYHLAKTTSDRFLTGWKQTFQRSELAKVTSQHAGRADMLFQKITAAYPLQGGALVSHGQVPVLGPFQRTDYFYGPDHLWYSDLREGFELPGFPDFLIPISIIDTMAELRPAKHYRESWNQAPFGPGFAARTLYAPTRDLVGAPQRFRNRLVVAPSLFGDQTVPARGSVSAMVEGSLKIFRDGQLFAQAVAPSPLRLFPVLPEQRATYRVEAYATRSPELFDLSTEVRATWTFQAEGGAANLLYPLPTLRFLPALDVHNRAHARAMLLPIEIERPFGAPTPAIFDTSVEVSFDDGVTWARVPIWRAGARALGLILHPRDASYVSLRGSASDVEGNVVEQTILRAYALK